MATLHSLHLEPFHENYLQALKAGDAATESHFVSYFGPWLQLVIRRQGVRAAQIQDLVQETFARVLTAVRSQSSVRHPERFGAFVVAVCRNVMLESFREKVHITLDGLTIDLPEPGPDPHAVVAAREAKETVERILGQLPSRDRVLLSGVFVEQRNKEEICNELGISSVHLRVLLHRAKRRFAILVKKEQSRTKWNAGFPFKRARCKASE